MTPILSVLMPVYNCREYIEDSVNSILNQTFKEFEFVIIDDCSDDGTFEFLSSVKDFRINLIRKSKNSGIVDSLNMGIKISAGKYLAKMHGDDISLPTRLEKQYAFMENNPEVVVCGTGYQAIGSSTFKFIPKTTNDDIITEMTFRCPFAHPSVMIRNSVLKTNNLLYNPDFESAEDYKMWTELATHGKLANLEDVLLYYRVHPNQITSRHGKKQHILAQTVIYEYVLRISRSSEYASYFCTIPTKFVGDYKKYIAVEEEIKNTLASEDIVVNESIFLERKVNYLKKSLFNKDCSVKTISKSLPLMIKTHNYLGIKYILKQIVKCLIR